ncbi:MAG: 30S ribosomal protein S11 [Candidatus Nomurabacteria bacterium]|jgi:small subunit ribosomal protein S11|nr:30S ribosomal protein S11 [Candidatus Nomurabacteria bacterium]
MTEEIKKTTTEEEVATTATDAASQESTSKPAPKKRGRKVKRSVPIGQAHIQATFNNTIVSFADVNGNILAASSAGACGFRGSKKGTAYAAQIAVDKAAEVAKNNFGLTKVDVFVKGVGLGRDASVRAILNHDMVINSITDVTGIPHGGVRPKKQRRA